MKLEATKRGLPAIWECGGGATNTGNSQVVAGENGERLKPIYIKRSGSLSNGEHALFIVKEGVVIIESDHHRKDFTGKILRIKEIMKVPCDRIHTAETDPCYICEGRGWNFEATVELVAEFSQGEWSIEVPENLLPALNAGAEKALCYHCREPHFVEEVKRDYAMLFSRNGDG